MFYRMTRLHFEEDRFGDMLEFAESMRARVQAISGLVSADIAKTGEGEGMIIAVYQDESDYQMASDEVAAILEGLGDYLTSNPHGHQGTVVFSFGDSVG